MRIDTLDHLVLEELQDIRSVEQKILGVLAGLARGDSVQGLWHVLMQLLTATEHRVKRFDRIVREKRAAGHDETVDVPSVEERTRRGHRRAVWRSAGAFPSTPARLTAREAEVLPLIAEGYANKQIAAKLAISIKTVEKHRQSLMAKLDLHDTAGVTRYAIAAGFVEASA